MTASGVCFFCCQIGRKFRDEARPKHGLLRCREFEMKGDCSVLISWNFFSRSSASSVRFTTISAASCFYPRHLCSRPHNSCTRFCQAFVGTVVLLLFCPTSCPLLCPAGSESCVKTCPFCCTVFKVLLFSPIFSCLKCDGVACRHFCGCLESILPIISSDNISNAQY